MDTEIAVQRALTDVDREVRGWLGDRDPLARTGLDGVASEFKRGVGEPAGDGLRRAPPAELGAFAARHDTVLYEFDDDPGFGAVVGYPAGERRWVPVLLCVAGPAGEAAELVGAFVEAAAAAADGELVRL
ncbi:MAG: hypothetical protein ABEH77_06375 [Halobacteriaceae archaeon]